MRFVIALISIGLSLLSHTSEAPETSARIVRPFAEYEKVQYFVMSLGGAYDSAKAKKQILRHLPSDVKLILYEEETFRTTHFIGRKHPIIFDNQTDKPGSTPAFWARDFLPYPVFENSKLRLIDGGFGWGDRMVKNLSQKFDAPISQIPLFQHGNFIANAIGDCLVVDDKKHLYISEETIRLSYGCKRMLLLPHRYGIGHADEVVKFTSDNVVVTNILEYIPLLTEMGLKVYLLPMAPPPTKVTKENRRSYVNGVLVNGVVLLPTFGVREDKIAAATFRSLGFKVAPIDSRLLADGGSGALHCLSMTYP